MRNELLFRFKCQDNIFNIKLIPWKRRIIIVMLISKVDIIRAYNTLYTNLRVSFR